MKLEVNYKPRNDIVIGKEFAGVTLIPETPAETAMLEAISKKNYVLGPEDKLTTIPREVMKKFGTTQELMLQFGFYPSE